MDAVYSSKFHAKDTDFYPVCMERGSRSERALKLAIAEMYLKGVSTRKVTAITKKLCGLDISSAQVSAMTKELDPQFDAFRNRPLGRLAYVFLDATYLKVRHNGIKQAISFSASSSFIRVELLPIHEFNETEYRHTNPKTGEQLCNYWGYSTVNFFAPMARYGTPNDFKALVKALHENGIEVILDVVFNHTAEMDIDGPTLSFRGIDPYTYYILDDAGHNFHYTGCGNTVNCNHPVVA